jgi:hypothetical protein
VINYTDYTELAALLISQFGLNLNGGNNLAALCERKREDRQRKGENESFGTHVPGCIFPVLQVIYMPEK